MDDLNKLSSNQLEAVTTFCSNVTNTGMICKDDILGLESKIGMNIVTDEVSINKFTDKLSSIGIESVSKRIDYINQVLDESKGNTLLDSDKVADKLYTVRNRLHDIKSYLEKLYNIRIDENVRIYDNLQSNLKNDDNFLEWSDKKLSNVLTDPMTMIFEDVSWLGSESILSRVYSYNYKEPVKDYLEELNGKSYDVLPIIIDDVVNKPEMFTGRVGTVGDMRNLLMDIPTHITTIETMIKNANVALEELRFIHRKEISAQSYTLLSLDTKFSKLETILDNDGTCAFINFVTRNLRK